jgi:hypothetical protein
MPLPHPGAVREEAVGEDLALGALHRAWAPGGAAISPPPPLSCIFSIGSHPGNAQGGASVTAPPGASRAVAGEAGEVLKGHGGQRGLAETEVVVADERRA